MMGAGRLWTRVAGALPALVLLTIVAGSVPAGAVDGGAAGGERQHSRWFLDGVSAYEAGDYVAAAGHFETLARAGVISGKLYYNLGNAYLKQGELGQAILWYERARQLLGPSDPDLNFNLDYARQRTVDEVAGSGVDWTRVLLFWRAVLPRSLLLVSGLLVYLGFWGLLCARCWVKNRSVRRASWISGLIAAGLLLTVALETHQARHDDRAVILPAAVAVRSGTHPDTTELFRLHAGAVVRVDREQEGYLRIRFGERGIGWVPSAVAGRVAVLDSSAGR